MNHRPLTALTVVALVGALAVGCSSTPTTQTSNSGGVTLVAPGILTVCTNPPFKPMEFVDTTGATVGFDIDLMKYAADKMGLGTNFIQTDFTQITSGAAMAAQKCDVGASSITITEARKQAVTFSAPYFAATQALMAKSDAGITGLASLKGKKLAVETDTTGADYANENAAANGYTVVVFEDGGTALNAVLAGRADACLIDRAIVYSFVADNPTTSVITEFQTGEQYGFVASTDANGQALMAQVNDALTAADADGTYFNLYKKWIDPNATSANLPVASSAPTDATPSS